MERSRPEPGADERGVLLGFLRQQRAIVHWKCEGLTDGDAYRAVLGTSPSMTVAGLVSHLRWAEHCWFEVLFLDRPAGPNPMFDEPDEDRAWKPDGVPLARLLAEYEEQSTISDGIVAAAAPEDPALNPGWGMPGHTLRWILAHMLEETARHAGHLDLVRELLDGRRGYQ